MSDVTEKKSSKSPVGSMGRQGHNVGAAKRYDAEHEKIKLSKQNRVSWPLTILAAIFSLTILVPLYFAIVSSLKDNASIGGFELPTKWNWGNYARPGTWSTTPAPPGLP